MGEVVCSLKFLIMENTFNPRALEESLEKEDKGDASFFL